MYARTWKWSRTRIVERVMLAIMFTNDINLSFRINRGGTQYYPPIYNGRFGFDNRYYYSYQPQYYPADYGTGNYHPEKVNSELNAASCEFIPQWNGGTFHPGVTEYKESNGQNKKRGGTGNGTGRGTGRGRGKGFQPSPATQQPAAISAQ